jgi:hypothetical protein
MFVSFALEGIHYGFAMGWIVQSVLEMGLFFAMVL